MKKRERRGAEFWLDRSLSTRKFAKRAETENF